jgi:phosphatidylglycerophosphate synthase
MLASAKAVYLATRKRHDLLFNHYFMRPIAAVAVVLFARTRITPNQLTIANLAIHLGACALLIADPTDRGGLLAILVLEVGYMLDCADGMLARHKKLASVEGHLFDFFTDEIKSLLLVAALGIRTFYTGSDVGVWSWDAGTVEILFATIVGTVLIASATSLTHFVRRPELTGTETPVEAHYETVDHRKAGSPIKRIAQLGMTFLQFLGHYPSHIWIFAAFGRLDLFFWIYMLIHALYLAKGWLGLLLRFGRP